MLIFILFFFKLGPENRYFHQFFEDRFNRYFKIAIRKIEKLGKNSSLKHAALRYKNEYQDLRKY